MVRQPFAPSVEKPPGFQQRRPGAGIVGLAKILEQKLIGHVERRRHMPVHGVNKGRELVRGPVWRKRRHLVARIERHHRTALEANAVFDIGVAVGQILIGVTTKHLDHAVLVKRRLDKGGDHGVDNGGLQFAALVFIQHAELFHHRREQGLAPALASAFLVMNMQDTLAPPRGPGGDASPIIGGGHPGEGRRPDEAIPRMGFLNPIGQWRTVGIDLDTGPHALAIDPVWRRRQPVGLNHLKACGKRSLPRQPHGQDQGLAVKHAGAKHQLGEPGKIKGTPGIAVSSLGPAPPQSLNLVAPVVGPIRVTPQCPVIRLG